MIDKHKPVVLESCMEDKKPMVTLSYIEIEGGGIVLVCELFVLDS